MDIKNSYSYNQIQSMTLTPFILSSTVMDVITFLNTVVLVPEFQQTIKKKVYEDKFRNNKFQKAGKQEYVKPILEDSWTTEKIIFNAKNTFKATKIEAKVGVEKDINEIRISLNKISSKNYDSQKDIILKLMTLIEDDDSLQKISQFIFDIASSNKFYSELYADLYQELISKSPIFKSILDIYVSTYKSTIDTIKYVDSDIDYGGYCDYVKENDKRRAMATFFMILSAREILSPTIILSIIEHFQTTLLSYIELEGKTFECDEISEIIFIMVSIGNNNPFIIKEDIWENNIIPNVLLVTKFKVKEHLSLTSRTVFKQMDLKDHLCKKKIK